MFHWKPQGVGWYLRVRLSFLEAKNKIPHKKLTASGTSRFDKDTYCKKSNNENFDIVAGHNSVTKRGFSSRSQVFYYWLLKDNERRSARIRNNGEATIENNAHDTGKTKNNQTNLKKQVTEKKTSEYVSHASHWTLQE